MKLFFFLMIAANIYFVFDHFQEIGNQIGGLQEYWFYSDLLPRFNGTGYRWLNLLFEFLFPKISFFRRSGNDHYSFRYTT